MNISFLFAKAVQKINRPIVKNSKINKQTYLGEAAMVYDSTIDRYSYIGGKTCMVNTIVGSFTSISSDCEIGLGAHPTNTVSTSPVFYKKNNCLKTNFSTIKFDEYEKTLIGNDVWIGSGVKIKSGVKIGDGAVIGAGSIVTKDVPPYFVVGGVPAKVIKKRFEQDVIDKLLQIQWWKWDDEKIKKTRQCFDCPEKLIRFYEKEQQ